VRTASLEHAQANAALLAATVRATRSRRPVEFKLLDAGLGVALESVAEQLRDRARADLGALATDEQLVTRTTEAAAKRPELDRIPPPPDRPEIRDIYRTSAAIAP
jgi:hypothetical protein